VAAELKMENFQTRKVSRKRVKQALSNAAIIYRVTVAWAGQTRGAIGLSLIFCFFCIKAKEKTKAMHKAQEITKPRRSC
jgi:hypothetical protein